MATNWDFPAEAYVWLRTGSKSEDIRRSRYLFQPGENKPHVRTHLFGVRWKLYLQCSWKTFMIHQTFVQWALYILVKFMKSLIIHLGLAIGNIRCVWWFSWTLDLEPISRTFFYTPTLWSWWDVYCIRIVCLSFCPSACPSVDGMVSKA